jgi:Nanos RNA binding domain
MTTRMYNRNMRVNSAKPQRPYKCKVCYDSGKSENMYNSHFLRETSDPKSRVVCPTLLSIVCLYCHKKGHTPSRCAKRERDDSTVTTCESVSTISTMDSTRNMYCLPVNKYTLLEEEEEEKGFIAPVAAAAMTSSASYMTALLKPKPVEEPSPAPKPFLTTVVAADGVRRTFFTKNWADYDSDDE